MRAHATSLQLQKDAKELAELCASVSDGMDHVKQGLLSKDAFEKLKRMEKLAKRVREELTQTSTTPLKRGNLRNIVPALRWSFIDS